MLVFSRSPHRPARNSFRNRKIAAASVCLVLAFSAKSPAATLVYDADANAANGITDGNTSAWNTSIAVWFNGTDNVAWPNTDADEAVFGGGSLGTAGSVAVGTVTANKITFNTPAGGAYTLTGGTITLATALAGPTPAITTNVNANINSLLAGTSGMEKLGSGILTLGGTAANTLTGTTTITAGKLLLSKTAGITAVAGDIVVNNGGTLQWSTANQVADTASITLNDGGTLYLDNKAETIKNLTINGGNANGGGGSNGAAFGISDVLTIAGNGNLGLNSNANWSAATVSLTTTNSTTSLTMTGNGGTTSQLVVGAGGLSMTGQTITLNSGVDSATAKGSQIVLNGNVTATGTNNFNKSGTNVGVAQVNIGNTTRTWNITGTTNVNVAIVGTTSGLTKTGVGTMVLGGIDANTYTGVTTVSEGILDLNKTAGVNSIVGDVIIGGTGTLRWLTANQVSDTATITLNAGGTLYIGAKTDTIGSLIINGGTANGGTASNGGTFNIADTFTINSGGSLGLNSSANWSTEKAVFSRTLGTVFNITGNGQTASSGTIAQLTIGSGGLTFSGGGTQTISLGTGTAALALGSQIVLNGDVIASGTNSIARDTSAGGNGVTQVNQGTNTRTWQIDSGTTTVGVNIVGTGSSGVIKTGGGTLALNAVNTYTGKTTVNQGVTQLGADGRIDSSPWIQVDGGATFRTTAITGGYTYAASGTGVISGTGTIDGSLNIGAGKVLKPGNTSNAASIATAGDAAGTLTITGSLLFNPNTAATIAELNIDSSGTADFINITGGLTLNANSNIKVTLGSGFTPAGGQTWTLIDWAGVLTQGGFSTGSNGRTGADSALNEGNLDLPDLTAYLGNLSWLVSNFSGNGSLTISIVPEPSRALLLMAGFMAMIFRRKRQLAA